jgi:hypothetical protein
MDREGALVVGARCCCHIPGWVQPSTQVAIGPEKNVTSVELKLTSV